MEHSFPSSANHRVSSNRRKLSEHETNELRNFIAIKFEFYLAQKGVKVNDVAKDLLMERITEIMNEKIDLMIRKLLSEEEIQDVIGKIVINDLRQLLFGRLISLLLRTVFTQLQIY
jgi:hypothetical protein